VRKDPVVPDPSDPSESSNEGGDPREGERGLGGGKKRKIFNFSSLELPSSQEEDSEEDQGDDEMEDSEDGEEQKEASMKRKRK
jgi:hypothetical protein